MSFIVLLVVFFQFASATYLPSPVQCNCTGCTVTYYQNIWLDRTACKAAIAVYPTDEEQLIDAVAYAAKKRMKVKVVSKGSHSYTKLVCPGGDEGLIISTQNYNSQILINATEMTVTADAGVELRDLVDRIAEAGLALPHTPYWEGVSVAGLISTGAHGSGLLGKGSCTHDYVVGMRLITAATEAEGYAKVVDLTTDDEDLDAARLSLGVLGAISQVTFQLEPMFKRSITLEFRADDRLEDEIAAFSREHEFGGLFWYPASGKALLKLDDRVGVEVEGEGAFKHEMVVGMDAAVIEAIRSSEVEAEKKRNSEELCTNFEMFMEARQKQGDGLVNHGNTFTHYPVVGFSHLIGITGGCQNINNPPRITATQLESETTHEYTCLQEEEPTISPPLQSSTCFWNPLIDGGFFFDTSISIPIARAHDAILDIKKLRDADTFALCTFTFYGGIIMRFLKASTAYLGEKTDAVVFEMVYYRSKEPNEPRFNEHIYEEIEQMLLKKYGGKPHWGKNRNLAFNDMASRTNSLVKFLATKKKLDPLGLFSSEWSDSILGISTHSHYNHYGQILKDHCALEGLCICLEDSHCHPTKGYYCKSGSIFKEARVCKYDEGSMYSTE